MYARANELNYDVAIYYVTKLHSLVVVIVRFFQLYVSLWCEEIQTDVYIDRS